MSFMASEQNMLNVIKAQTALGKTKTILELVENELKRILIAVPTIALRSEICERAAMQGIKMIESPSLREIKDDLPRACSIIQTLCAISTKS